MKVRFESREEVEEFLVGEFPDKNPARVVSVFEWAFFDGRYEATEGKKTWTRKHAETLRRATSMEKAAQKGKNRGDAKALEKAAADLRGDIELERIWHKNFPKTGGADPADYALADWVRMGFEDLDEPITFGISAVETGEPSTKFGRVVKAALNWRKSAANWRRPTEASAKGEGPLT